MAVNKKFGDRSLLVTQCKTINEAILMTILMAEKEKKKKLRK